MNIATRTHALRRFIDYHDARSRARHGAAHASAMMINDTIHATLLILMARRRHHCLFMILMAATARLYSAYVMRSSEARYALHE